MKPLRVDDAPLAESVRGCPAELWRERLQLLQLRGPVLLRLLRAVGMIHSVVVGGRRPVGCDGSPLCHASDFGRCAIVSPTCAPIAVFGNFH